jgi:hypothetical protein
VVIDMQPECFFYARWVLKPVLAQMHEAERQQQGIVLVRYEIADLDTEIAPDILQAYDQFSRRALATKTQRDGSEQVLAACAEANLCTSVFRVCGVTTDECITETVHGLARLCPAARIEVIMSACESWQGKRYDWSRFSHLPNVFPV